MYACMHVCMYACMHVCMYACMHVCMCVRVFMYVNTYVYVTPVWGVHWAPKVEAGDSENSRAVPALLELAKDSNLAAEWVHFTLFGIL